MWYTNGDKCEGFWSNGTLNGLGTYQYNDGMESEVILDPRINEINRALYERMFLKMFVNANLIKNEYTAAKHAGESES
jgi:hypothetical protein